MRLTNAGTPGKARDGPVCQARGGRGREMVGSSVRGEGTRPRVRHTVGRFLTTAHRGTNRRPGPGRHGRRRRGGGREPRVTPEAPHSQVGRAVHVRAGTRHRGRGLSVLPAPERQHQEGRPEPRREPDGQVEAERGGADAAEHPADRLGRAGHPENQNSAAPRRASAPAARGRADAAAPVGRPQQHVGRQHAARHAGADSQVHRPGRRRQGVRGASAWRRRTSRWAAAARAARWPPGSSSPASTSTTS